jgi:hypothetical protein
MCSGHMLEAAKIGIRGSGMDPTGLRPVQWRAHVDTVIKLLVP